MVQPAVVLWTDDDGQWQPIVSQLHRLMPQLLTYGEYEPESRKGPAIWQPPRDRGRGSGIRAGRPTVLAQRFSCRIPNLVQVFHGTGQGEGLDLVIAQAITLRDTDRVAVLDQDAFSLRVLRER